MDEGRRSFAQVLKYLRHILEGFCKGGDEEGGRRVLEDFSGIIKYLRHLWEGFCSDHEIF